MDGPERFKVNDRGKFEIGIVSLLQTALNGRPGAMQFLRELYSEGWGKGVRKSTPDGPKWTARSKGEGLEWRMGGQGEHKSTLQTALNGRPGAEEAVGGGEVKEG